MAADDQRFAASLRDPRFSAPARRVKKRKQKQQQQQRNEKNTTTKRALKNDGARDVGKVVEEEEEEEELDPRFAALHTDARFRVGSAVDKRRGETTAASRGGRKRDTRESCDSEVSKRRLIEEDRRSEESEESGQEEEYASEDSSSSDDDDDGDDGDDEGERDEDPNEWGIGWAGGAAAFGIEDAEEVNAMHFLLLVARPCTSYRVRKCETLTTCSCPPLLLLSSMAPSRSPRFSPPAALPL